MSETAAIDRLLEFPAEAAVCPRDPIVRKAIYEAHGGLDFWLRSPLEFQTMTLDHVVPTWMGGLDNAFNLVPTAPGTNRRKGDKYDAIGTPAALAIIRIYYGRDVLERLRCAGYRKADELARKDRLHWSRAVGPLQLAGLRISRRPIRSPIERYLEDNRVWFAEAFRDGRLWHWSEVGKCLGEHGVTIGPRLWTTRPPDELCDTRDGERVALAWTKIVSQAREAGGVAHV
jgi:hypothetical protein